MSVNNYAQKALIDLFKSAAQLHPSINYFSAGHLEYIFGDNHDQVFPSLYIQTLGAEYNTDEVRQEYSFRAYLFDKPVQDTQVDHTEFEYDY